MRHAFLIALLARLALGGAPPTPRLLPALRRAVDAVLPVAASRSLQDEPSGEVTVDFSPRSPANQALAKALRFEDSGDWTRAAHIYQRLLAETPAELCQVSPRLYRPVGAYALERIAAFPADSLRDYRQSIEPAADQAWRDALDSGSLTDLERVSRQFLLSHRGDDALDRLATAWLARGRAGAALRAWASLLRSCPESDVDLAALTVKLAFALRQLGRPGAAAALLDEAIAILGADTTVPFAGAPVPLSTLRSRVARSVHRTRDDAAWPLLRGDALQSRTAALAVRPGALAWSQQLHPRTTVEAKRPPYMQTRLGSAPQRGPVTILPVLADGLAIYPSRRAIHARRTATGKLAWATAWPSFPDRALDPFASPGRTSGIWSCSVDRGRVYCSVPLERTTYGTRQMETRGELLALGLAKGQLLWRLTATSLLPKPLESGWFTSPPTAYDNSLLIGLRGGESGYEYHLCALDADDGRLLWRTFLASRPSTTQYGGYGTRRWFEGPPAVSDGLAVADTEGGALAAVDVATGRVRWLSRYDQRPLSWRFSSYRTVEGWRTAGAVISDGIVYATPTSSDFAYAVDLGSGHILWRRERRDDAYLAAVRAGRAYFVGSRATCVGRRGTVLWDVGLPQPATGRPVLAGRVLHIPLQSMLIFLDADSGHVLHRSVWTAWEEGHAPVWNAHIASGDLLVAAGSLFASTQYTLNAFAPAHPLPDIEHALAASPDRPDLHLALAVEKQWEGALALAAKSYEKALALAIEPSEHFTEDHRRQARSHLSATYTELARQHEAGGRTEAALRASRAAL
ncbi:PQQ-binding-like beta-propeller repeat protein, partial [bacterium]|nr:PQQ-binding-like beta-propeller repeat protein [bacterium]